MDSSKKETKKKTKPRIKKSNKLNGKKVTSQKLHKGNNLTLEQRKKGGANRKGKRNTKTIIKEILGLNDIQDLKPDVLYNWKKLLTNRRSTKYVFLANKEVSKYLFPQMREHKLEGTGTINFIVNPLIAGNTPTQNHDAKPDA